MDTNHGDPWHSRLVSVTDSRSSHGKHIYGTLYVFEGSKGTRYVSTFSSFGVQSSVPQLADTAVRIRHGEENSRLRA